MEEEEYCYTVECDTCGSAVEVESPEDTTGGYDDRLPLPVRYELARLALAWFNAQMQVMSAVLRDGIGLLNQRARLAARKQSIDNADVTSEKSQSVTSQWALHGGE